jgi:GEVED domain/Secretion system C-terminal sorting domain
MRKIKLITFFVIFFVCTFSNLSAQVSSYSFAESAGAYSALGGTNSTATGDDGIQNGIPIGFNFVFGGTTYTHFCITTNGFIKLGNAATTITTLSANYTNSLSNAATNRPLIAAFWDDNHRNTGTINYTTSGTAPNQVLTVDWNSVNIGGDGATSATNLASYQIKIYQTSNRVEIIYSGTMNAAGTLTASAGLNDNTSFLSVTPGSPGTASGATANNAISATTNMVGKKYTFSPPSCSAPGGLAASAITTTSATISWTAAGGATGYEWAVTTSATPPASGTATALTSINATGLSANTLYYAHVRTNCGGTFSSWTTISFTTSCSAANIPYIMPISSVIAPAPPNCTTIQDANGVPNTWRSFSAITGLTGWTFPLLGYPFNSTNAADDWIFTQGLNLTGGVSYRLRFTYNNDGSVPADAPAYYPEKLKVMYGANSNAASMTTLLADYPTVANATPQQAVIDFTPASTGVYYVGFQAYSDADQDLLLLDDISVDLTTALPPPCVTNVSPANGATGVVLGTGASRVITWNAAPAAISYDIYFGTVNPPTTNIGNLPAPGLSATITGLRYDSTYYWYVVPIGSAGPAIGCSTNTTSFTAQSVPPNCVPFYGTGATENCAGGDRITLFRLKGESSELNINTGSACNSPAAYVDSTDHPVIITMARGKSYWGQVQCGFGSNVIAIWIDYNDNGIFESAEKMMNNLTVGTTLTNINLFIPLTAALGNHRMRVRDVFAPPGLIDACALYTYGETEDYTVNIVSGGTSYTISTYTSAGACYTGGGAITVDAASNNNSNYVPLVDSSNALIAQLYPQNNNLGRVSTSYYKHNGPVRQDAGGRYYLDRNLTITVANQPTTPYNLRYPYRNTELNALIAQPGSGVTSQFDLVMTKNGDACLNAIGTGGTGGLVFFPTGFGSISGDRFVDVTNITGGFSSFYLHSGSTPIPVNLVKFEVQRNGKVNQAAWSTSQEVNTSHFVVERSNDGRSFTAIGQVAANGNSNVLLTYSFTDNSPVRGINYYRLRVVDRDNTGKYSAVRSVRNEGLADVAIYPNPVNDVMTVSITADKAERGEMIIADISGKIVYTRTLNIAQGDNKLPVNVSNMASGAYIIKVQLNDDIVIRKFNKL